MSRRSKALRFATPEQLETIERLSREILWRTSFNDWIEARFGREPHGGREDATPQMVIDELESKLRNQKSPATILDPERPATPEQFAAIERLSRAIRWGTGFDKWLRRVYGVRQVVSYGQAECVIAGLKDKLTAQLQGYDRHDPGRAAEGERDGSHQECAHRR